MRRIGRIHHFPWQPETGSNVGAVFPWWDMLFGTYRATPRAPHATMPLEVRDACANRLWWLLRSIAWRTLPAPPPVG